MDTASSLHSYIPLSGPNHIRLIRLEPSLHVEGPLRFSFITGDLLDFQDQYEAVSYTWGEPLLIYPLHDDDGKHVMVTANLDQALRRLRLPVASRSLWADAVCIDQQNDVEKAQQIPLMTQIFRNATRVQAWVGGDSEEERGMQHLSKLSRYSRGQFDSGQYFGPIRDDIDSIFSMVSKNEILICHFLNLPWFSRLWIIQEVVFNNDIILLCCTSELTWSRLTSALFVLHHVGPQVLRSITREKYEALITIAQLWRHHSMICEFGRPSESSRSPPAELTYESNILGVVDQFSYYQCSDSRDRLYALYSMTADMASTQYSLVQDGIPRVYMDVNYALDVRETYQVFALACARSGHVVDILNAVLSRQYHRCAEHWPSWVPDWRNLPLANRLGPFVLRKEPVSGRRSPFWITGDIEASGRLLVTLRGLKRLYLTYTLPVLPCFAACRVLHTFPLGKSDEEVINVLHKLYIRYSINLSILLYLLLDDAVSRDPELYRDHVHGSLPPWDKYEIDNYLLNISIYLDPSKPLRPDFYRTTLAKITDRIRQAIAGQCFFLATSDEQPKDMTCHDRLPCLGYGNAAMQAGDHLRNYQDKSPMEYQWRDWIFPALLLRPVQNTTENAGDSTASYRLIGTVYVIHKCIDEELEYVRDFDASDLTEEEETVERFYLM